MENKLEYSFDDEVVSKFCYDMFEKKIDIYFTGYSDTIKNECFLDKNCVLTIENWSSAKSKIDNPNDIYDYKDLDVYIGVFSMILHIEKQGEDLYLSVNTINDKYISLLFIKPVVSFKII